MHVGGKGGKVTRGDHAGQQARHNSKQHFHRRVDITNAPREADSVSPVFEAWFMKSKISAGLFSLLISITVTRFAAADVTLPKIFSSHMVLQQDKPIIIWGWANPGEAVAVDLGTSTGKATATDQG